MWRSAMPCWAAAVLLLLVCGCLVDQPLRQMSERPLPAPLPADQIRLTEGIIYARRGNQTLQFDMFRPSAERGLLPAVVCIHGGGWREGRRDDSYTRGAARFLASYGYITVSPTYRLAPEHPFPAAVVDVRDCVRWLRHNARQYNLDPERIGALGISAGGHLALMLGLTGEQDRFGPEDRSKLGESPQVRVVVNFCGPADLGSKNVSLFTREHYLKPFLRGRPGQQPEAYQQASPITYVHGDSPPILTFQGTLDPLVSAADAVRFHKKLDEARAPNRLILLQGQGHLWTDPVLTHTLRASVVFLNEYLKPAPLAVTRLAGRLR